MAADAPTTTPEAATATAPAAPTEPAKATEGDDQLPDGAKKALAAARRAERDAVARAAELEAKVTEYEQRDKSQAEKDAEAKAKSDREAASSKAEALRLRVALEKQVPAALIDRLRGNTKAELEADADALLELVGNQQAAPTFDGGARTTAPVNDMDSAIRQAAGR